MIYNLKPGRHGYTLLEIMIVIGITAVLLGMMMYRHMYSIDRTTFNSEAQTFASEVRTLSNLAKKVGLLTPASLLNSPTTEKDTNLQTVINSGYCVWAILSRKTGGNVNSAPQIVRKGILTSRKPVKVAVSQSYRSVAPAITCGTWLELYAIANPNQFNSFSPGTGNAIARIVYTPRGTPLTSGVIEVGYIENNAVTRGIRLDLERNGSVGYCEGNASPNGGGGGGGGGLGLSWSRPNKDLKQLD